MRRFKYNGLFYVFCTHRAVGSGSGAFLVAGRRNRRNHSYSVTEFRDYATFGMTAFASAHFISGGSTGCVSFYLPFSKFVLMTACGKQKK